MSARAATPQSDCTAYMTVSDTDYRDSSFKYGTHWSDGNVPGLGSTNYVGSGYELCSLRQETSKSYPGDVLSLAGTFISWDPGSSVVWPELRFQDGADYRFSSAGHVDGKVVVESGAGNPAAISFFYSTGNTIYCNLYADFYGAEDSEFILRRRGERPSGAKSMAYQIGGDWSEYYGKLRIAYDTTVSFTGGQTTFGGTLCRESGSTITLPAAMTSLGGLELESCVTQAITSATDPLTVGTLTLADGAVLEMSADATGATRPIVVTDRIVSGLANLKLTVASGYVFGASPPPKFEVFRFASAAAETASSFPRMYVTVSATGAPTGAKFARLVTDENALGGRSVYVTCPTADFTMNTANGTGDKSAFTAGNEGYWVDSVVPTESSSGTAFITEAISFLENKTYAFPKLTFELASGQSFYNHGNTFSCTNLVLWPGAGVNVYRNRNTTITGKTTIMPGANPVSFKAWEYKEMFLNGKLCGSGDIRFLQNSTKPGKYHISVDASGFSGNMQFGGESTSEAIAYIEGGSFGGPYAGSTAWKSITFTNNMPISFVSDISMTEPTRGIFIASDTTFSKAGSKDWSLTITEPITYNGVLKKNFGGSFVLGGTARFTDGDSASEPVSGKNKLQVKAGTLKVVSPEALNGVQLELSDGVTLILDPTPDDKDMLVRGIVNTRWATPFVSGAADGKIAVKIESDPIFSTTYEPFRVPICTVASAAANSLTFDLDTTSVRHGKVVQGRTVNADGTVTCYVDFRLEGMMIFVR